MRAAAGAAWVDHRGVESRTGSMERLWDRGFRLGGLLSKHFAQKFTFQAELLN